MHDDHSHPTPRDYIIVGVVLAIVTIIELQAAEMPALASIRVPFLLVLTLVKAALVAMYFMHLKSDTRLYTLYFCIGIFVFALPFTIVMLALF